MSTSSSGVDSKAPFCQLGDDCFADVDHKKLAMDVKTLALNLVKNSFIIVDTEES
jgi:hypothetical protein